MPTKRPSLPSFVKTARAEENVAGEMVAGEKPADFGRANGGSESGQSSLVLETADKTQQELLARLEEVFAERPTPPEGRGDRLDQKDGQPSILKDTNTVERLGKVGIPDAVVAPTNDDLPAAEVDSHTGGTMEMKGSPSLERFKTGGPVVGGFNEAERNSVIVTAEYPALNDPGRIPVSEIMVTDAPKGVPFYGETLFIGPEDKGYAEFNSLTKANPARTVVFEAPIEEEGPSQVSAVTKVAGGLNDHLREHVVPTSSFDIKEESPSEKRKRALLMTTTFAKAEEALTVLQEKIHKLGAINIFILPDCDEFVICQIWGESLSKKLENGSLLPAEADFVDSFTSVTNHVKSNQEAEKMRREEPGLLLKHHEQLFSQNLERGDFSLPKECGSIRKIIEGLQERSKNHPLSLDEWRVLQGYQNLLAARDAFVAWKKTTGILLGQWRKKRMNEPEKLELLKGLYLAGNFAGGLENLEEINDFAGSLAGSCGVQFLEEQGKAFLLPREYIATDDFAEDYKLSEKNYVGDFCMKILLDGKRMSQELDEKETVLWRVLQIPEMLKEWRRCGEKLKKFGIVRAGELGGALKLKCSDRHSYMDGSACELDEVEKEAYLSLMTYFNPKSSREC